VENFEWWAVNCGFVTDVSHLAACGFETSVKFTCIIEVDMGHFHDFDKLGLMVVAIDEAWMDVCQIADRFGLSHAEAVCFKIHLFSIQPRQKLVRFNSMLDVVECMVAVDLASDSKLIFLHFSIGFPITAEECLEYRFSNREFIFPDMQCTLSVNCSDCESRVEVRHCQEERFDLWNRVVRRFLRRLGTSNVRGH